MNCLYLATMIVVGAVLYIPLVLLVDFVWRSKMPAVIELENDWEFLGEQCGVELYHNLLTGEYKEVDIIELMENEHVSDSILYIVGFPIAATVFGNPDKWSDDFKYYKGRDA